CRSPAAHGLFEAVAAGDPKFEIESSGLYHGHHGELPDPRMRKHASRRGYSLTHRARPFLESDFADFDIVVGMDDANISALRRMAPSVEDEAKIVPMIDFVADKRGFDYIPDPYYEGAEGFELVLDLLEDGCRNMYEALKK
ncbi:MAG: low molecular weight phosphotyrosine protein phosphatase, partial [Muribaculum sp.]|nr:low molecular weight phosphotyrosine protein phosphatase [Muribaculum sp.]